MRTSDFSYELPPDLVAQEPLARRESSRLLCLDRRTGHIGHREFSEFPDLLRPGDRLVLNDTKVLKARLRCRKQTGGQIELLFTRRLDIDRWECLTRPSRHLRTGTELLPNAWPEARLVLERIAGDGVRIAALGDASVCHSIEDLLQRAGEVPLPPYISRSASEEDANRYQTVYAKSQGAIAAPTAGLHFSRDLLDRIRSQGIDISFVTLHVGIGTFRPVSVENPLDHPMHSEQYQISEGTVRELAETRRAGGRVVAVGTTVVRVLESCSQQTGEPAASQGETRLLILPGYTFRAVDALVTNFHLPRSTLLMLVSAFAGTEHVLQAYAAAIRERYRFYSYGDAMFIF